MLLLQWQPLQGRIARIRRVQHGEPEQAVQ